MQVRASAVSKDGEREKPTWMTYNREHDRVHCGHNIVKLDFQRLSALLTCRTPVYLFRSDGDSERDTSEDQHRRQDFGKNAGSKFL
jgi:hypothetical protein